MASPYRVNAEQADAAEAPRELVYRRNRSDGQGGRLFGAIALTAAGIVGGLTASSLVGLAIGIGISAAASVGGLVQWRRAAATSRMLLRVERGAFSIVRRGESRPLVDVRLADLEDVILDTKSIRKVVPGQDTVPGLQFIDSKVGPEINVSRIGVCVSGRDAPVLLGDDYLSHIDAVEWTGKIRSFLRTHGWLPIDERETEEEDDDG